MRTLPDVVQPAIIGVMRKNVQCPKLGLELFAVIDSHRNLWRERLQDLFARSFALSSYYLANCCTRCIGARVCSNCTSPGFKSLGRSALIVTGGENAAPLPDWIHVRRTFTFVSSSKQKPSKFCWMLKSSTKARQRRASHKVSKWAVLCILCWRRRLFYSISVHYWWKWYTSKNQAQIKENILFRTRYNWPQKLPS